MNINAFKSPQRVDTQWLGRMLYIPTVRLTLSLSSLSPSLLVFFVCLLYYFLFAQKKQKKPIQGGKWFTYQIKQQLRAYLVEVFESVSYLFSVWLCVMRDRLRFGWNVATPTLQHLTQPAGTKYCGKTERGGRWDGDEKTGTTCEEAWQPCVFFECICAPRDKTLEFSQSSGVHSALCMCTSMNTAFHLHVRHLTFWHVGFNPLAAECRVKDAAGLTCRETLSFFFVLSVSLYTNQLNTYLKLQTALMTM